MPHGVSTGAPIWTWFGQGGGGVSGTAGGGSGDVPTTGSVRVGGTTYSYTCSGGELVRFSAG